VNNPTNLKRSTQIALGIAVLLSLLLHALSKPGDVKWEMLWNCNVFSLIIAIGLLTGSARAVAAGFLFHISLGFFGWAVMVVTTRWISATSILVHVLPPVAGALYLWNSQWPRHTALIAWFINLGLTLPSLWLTPSRLNINNAFGPWGPIADDLAGHYWYFQASYHAIHLAALAGIEALIVWWLALRRARLYREMVT
jgi:hypothetical protein